MHVSRYNNYTIDLFRLMIIHSFLKRPVAMTDDTNLFLLVSESTDSLFSRIRVVDIVLARNQQVGGPVQLHTKTKIILAVYSSDLQKIVAQF